jgi:hypothetical protein
VAQNDARYLGQISVFYPLHPFFGRDDVSIRRRLGTGRVEQIEIESNGRRQFIPTWMTNQDACGRLSISSEAYCSVPALLELAALLESCDL